MTITDLEGQPNFRDLGGPLGLGGFTVAGGQIFRSGELSALTDRDLATLESLGMHTVVDLRSDRERELQPNRLPDSATYVSVPILPGGDGWGVARFLETFDPADFPPWDEVYRALVRNHTVAFGRLIRLVADADARPVMFHCGTGKDRTGIASALLLTLLGVSRSDIEEDYLCSNDHLLPGRAEILDRWIRGLDQRGIKVDSAGRARLERMMGVEASYLDAAWDEMIVLDGSVEAYIRNSLRVEDELRDSLRFQLLH